MADLIGQMLGQYQILEQIGMGGMATVYKAYQASMDRYVAVKVLPKQLAEDPTFFGRFEQEARTIAKLENKHVLPVYDYGQHDGYTYLVMRYVGTGNLKQVVSEQGALPLPDAVDYFTQIADALQYAHDHGVIHRDVKTSNVLVGEGRQCYLTDFGIARLVEGSAQFTGTGTVLGTPAYMSPEQCNGLPADARSDIYSLGVVLYEMLTGMVPFEAETPVAVVLMHVKEPLRSPRLLNPNIPEAVEQAVFRAMAKEPDHRYQTAHEFSTALRDAFDSFTQRQTVALSASALREMASASTMTDMPASTQASETTVPLRRAAARPRWLLYAGLAALALVVAAVAILALAGGGDEDEESPDADVPPGGADVTPAPAVSETADSSWTVFTSTYGNNNEDRRLIVRDDALWMSTGGGMVRWNRDGTFTKITSQDGLTYHDIQTMQFDRDGNLWLGGGDDQWGVMRARLTPEGSLAGVDFYDEENSDLRSYAFWTFLPQPDGTLLAGTYGGLIEYWDGTRWGQPPFPTVGSALDGVGDRVYVLARSQDGVLWAGGPNGLAQLSGDTWERVEPPEDLQGQEITNYGFYYLYVDPLDGAIWVGFWTDPGGQTHLRRLVPPAEDGGPWTWETAEDWFPAGAREVLRTSDGALWVMEYGEIIRSDPASGARTVFSSDRGVPGEDYRDLVEDTDGTLWLSTADRLVHYDGRRWIPFTVENEPITGDAAAMAEAADGSLWFVSTYGVLTHYAAGIWETVDQLDTLTMDLALQGDTLWVASEGGLIRRENGAIRRFTSADGLVDDYVIAVEVDPVVADVLWVGTRRGLNALNTAEGTVIATWKYGEGDFPGPAIATLYFDAGGVLWVGTGYDENWTGPGTAALLRFPDRAALPDAAWEVVSDDAPLGEYDQWVTAVHLDGQGRLWMGTVTGIFLREGERWRHFTAQDAAPESASVVGILTVGEITWVATDDEGLYRTDPQGWLYLGRAGIGTESILRMQQTSDGAIWILTQDGIVRLVGDPLEFAP